MVGPIIQSRELTPGSIRSSLVASDASVEAALEPVKLLEGIGEGGFEIGGRSAVQPVRLD
jgi:hypothetical protein